MTRAYKICLIGLGVVLLQACAAAEFGIGLEAEALTLEEGAALGEMAEIGAEEGIAGRIAAEAVESGRFLAPRGALVRALGELADTDSVVTIDRLGRIAQQGRYLATIEADGTLTADAGAREVVVGRIAQGELYEVSSEGTRAVARLRGFVPSRGVRLLTSPSTGATSVEILHDEVAAEILQIRDGWYEIRLPDGTTGWVWAPAIAALLIQRGISQSSSCRCSDEPGAVLLKTGEILPYTACTEYGEAIVLRRPDGREITIDHGLVETVLCGSDSRIPVAGTRVELSTGVVVYADSIVSDGTAALITTRTGERLAADGGLIVEPQPSPALP